MLKKKGPAARELTGPKRMTEARRLLDSKIAEIESQEYLLLFLFVENYSKILTEPMIELIWDFMQFLKSADYHIISGQEVFCFPASKLVKFSDLK
ncbi:hypothetical protein ES705_12932 [subsurface metagenome]